MFSIDGAFVSATTELPGISMENSPKVYQKGHNSELFGEMKTSGNAKVEVLAEMRRKLD